MAFFDQIKEKCSAAAIVIGSKARHGTEIVKNAGERRTLDNEIRRLYGELGRTIYESKGQDMDACRDICEKIDECRERLEALAARDVQIRIRNRCPQCGAAMNRKAKFCSACGAAMPEAETTSEE